MELPFVTFLGLGVLLTLGTVYSVTYQTYLDTSNPLLSFIPHPLADAHYFASKKSLLNTIFIKNAWGWTSGAFFLLFALASKLPADPFPPTAANEEVEEKKNGRFVYRAADNKPDSKRKLLRWEDTPSDSQLFSVAMRPLLRWLVLTVCWVLFTAWFFGPALLTRITLATGGECVLVLPPALPAPPADADFKITAMPTAAQVFPVPAHLCHARAPITAETHPNLFADIIARPGFTLPAGMDLDGLRGRGLKGRPRVHGGHDVSGHAFLVTVAALFLAELIQVALARLRALDARVPRVMNGRPAGVHKSLLTRAVEAETNASGAQGSGKERETRGWNRVERRVVAYKVAVGFASVLLGIWVLATYTTGIYFHTPMEKVTGFVLGALTYAFSLYVLPNRGIAISASKESSNKSKKNT